jgi:LysR family transcriptional regulator (chromosome initiation inhibitor)
LLTIDLHPDQLQALLAVSDLGTFDAAARHLRVTPSAISQRMKALESSVGRVLLTRTKPVVLTESGRVVLRLARQLALLHSDAERALDGDEERATSMPIAINADSLATWALEPLAELATASGLVFDIYREDQAHSTDLLRAGTVMAAVTSEPVAVQGCSVTPIGRMRYRPMASRSFAERWFASGATTSALAAAPVVLFDRKDTLQHRYLERVVGRAVAPPTHYIPTSVDFARAIRLGFGWGMLPDAQADHDDLVVIDHESPAFVPLYWQQWKLESPSLAAVAVAIARAAPRD